MASPGDQLYRAVTRIFSVIIIGFGIAILIVTFARGASIGSAGLWIGVLFCAVGGARLYIAQRTRN